MPPATSSREAPKKRNRKRKRRQAASSSSSSSSSSEEEGVSTSKPLTTNQPVITPEEPIKEDTEDSSSSSSSEDDSTSGDDDNAETKSPKDAKRQLPSRSPSPVDHRLPINIPLEPSNEEEMQRDVKLKEKFRKFWMRTTAEGFKDELGQIQKEPNMTQPKLAMLIDALSTGANVYMPSHNESSSTSERGEVELLLGVHK